MLIFELPAQKYKDYNRIRDILCGKAVDQAPSVTQKKVSRKRKHEAAPILTPSKRLQVTKTPSKSASHPAAIDPYDSPSLVRNLYTPSHNRVIGPTPQKDGQVLGLFDLLSEEGGDTPSKGQITIIGPDGKVQGTPRKPIDGGGDFSDMIKHSRTPVSSRKRFMLDKFGTPLKGRHPNELAGKTPLSASKLHFATPSFLRRDSHHTAMHVIHESGESLTLSPEMVRLPRKPIVRGLSSMLAGLRKMEEEAADDDLDVLREVENENSGLSKPVNKGAVLVEDSQFPVLLGGFDDEAMFDSEPEEVKNPLLGRDGQPLKIWKKKGQKRSTRRVTIKPVRNAKSQPTSQAQAPNDAFSDEPTAQPDEEEAVPETQQATEASGNFDSDSASEYTASEGGTRHRRLDQGQKKKKMTVSGKVKSVTRKVGAMAHANFKRLKLRNSGSKGGVGHRSRFRRKR